MSDRLIEFYREHHDEIRAKRFESPYPVRRAVHREIYQSVIDHVPKGVSVLDAGCGEGVLSLLLAEDGSRHVTAVDLSEPNIWAAREFVREKAGSTENPRFLNGNAAQLPFEDSSFDCVVSNHVLEHLPDFEEGIRELHRVTRDLAVVAVPTCFNLGSFCLLGRGNYWKLSPRALVAAGWGASRVLLAWLMRRDGVNEGYAGDLENLHIFRFPWVTRRLLEKHGFEVVKISAQSFCIPYFDALNRKTTGSPLRDKFPFSYLGLGTVYVARKR